VPGKGLIMSVDWRLQEIAEAALRDELLAWGKGQGRRLAGAVAAIDPRDGGVLALASYPNFDPNDFSGGISSAKYKAYLDDALQPLYDRGHGGVLALASYPNFDPNDFSGGISSAKYKAYLDDALQPLYDRAIGAATPTGSTFKMVTGSAAISSGVIGKDQVLYDSGSWYCHGTTFTDIAAGGIGTTDFVRALAASSDGYFYQLGDRLGHTRLRYYATQYGLGSKLGIDLPGEYGGNWPTNAWSMKTYGLPLEPSDVCQLAIGQGAMQATPLQIANVAATIVNGGTLYRPHVVAAIRDASGHVVRLDRDVIRRVPVTAEALREVRAGMDQVTDPGGTAYGLAIPGLPFGGKTGTVETDGGQGPNTTWFVAYAPAAHPTIALAVFMERTGGYGASVAAPVARRIMAEYFHKKLPG
jgi:penicillin-binding protein 2